MKAFNLVSCEQNDTRPAIQRQTRDRRPVSEPKDFFIGIVSHDGRRHLNGIVGAIVMNASVEVGLIHLRTEAPHPQFLKTWHRKGTLLAFQAQGFDRSGSAQAGKYLGDPADEHVGKHDGHNAAGTSS